MLNYIPIITIGLIIGSVFLIRNAKKKNSIEGYGLAIVAGVITFLFEPLFLTLYARINQINETIDGGAIQIASSIVGVYCIIWSIVKIVKLKRNQKEVQQKIKE